MFLVSTTGNNLSFVIDDFRNLQGDFFRHQFNHPMIAFDLSLIANETSLNNSLQLEQAFNNLWLKKVNGGIDPNNDEAVKSSSDDLVSGTLVDKLIAGNNIDFELITEIGGNKKVKINSTATGGSGSDKNFVFHQATSTIGVIVNHNLGKYPSVNITDEFGELISVMWKHIDTNSIMVSPDIPTTFKVFCN